MKSIAFVDHTPFIGGAQLVLLEHIKALDTRLFRAVVICSPTTPDFTRELIAAGACVEVVDFPSLRHPKLDSLMRLWRTIVGIRRLLHEYQVDLVVTNTTRASYFCAAAMLGLPIPVIWWVRDFLYPRALFRLMWGIPTRVIFVSRAVAATYGALHERKSVVFHVASSLYQELPVSREVLSAARQRYGLDASSLVIGFMGRLVEEKGAQDVIAAFKLIAPSYPKVRLLIVGTGHGQQHDIESGLRASVTADEQLSQAVIFAGFQADQATHYSLFDIFVLSTRDREPFATSVVQAMMAGAAVIGTDAGGTPELVDPGHTGLLYPPGNVEALANCLRKLIENPEHRKSLAKQGRDRVLQYHTEEDLARRAEALYRDIIDPDSRTL
jgi:glycosyltransferase involved in cell wall biosynthesis